MRRRGVNLRKGFLRASLPFLRLLPPRTALKVVGGFGRLEYQTRRSIREEVQTAIGEHRDFFSDAVNPELLGPDLAANQIRSRARDLLIEGLSASRLEELFEVKGRESLDEAYQKGRGVVLLGNHFGAYLLMACWMIRQGYPWRMFAERPRHVSRLLAQQFAIDGPLGQSKLFISRKTNPTEAAGAILRAARVLRAGITVSVAADVRWSGPMTATGLFLGRTYRFSSTWVTLAGLTGAPVVPGFCAMTPEGTYRLEFAPAYEVPPSHAKDPQAAQQWVQRALDLIQERVYQNPANSIDYFFWDPETAIDDDPTDSSKVDSAVA